MLVIPETGQGKTPHAATFAHATAQSIGAPAPGEVNAVPRGIESSFDRCRRDHFPITRLLQLPHFTWPGLNPGCRQKLGMTACTSARKTCQSWLADPAPDPPRCGGNAGTQKDRQQRRRRKAPQALVDEFFSQLDVQPAASR